MSLDLDRPFTAAEAMQAGVTRPDLISRRFTRLHWGCYISAEVPVTQRVMVLAALKVVPSAEFAAHHTAARLLELPVPDTSAVHLGTTLDRRTKRRLIQLHRYCGQPEICRVDQLRLTSLRQIFVDLAPGLGLVETVVLGDAILRRADQSIPWLRDWMTQRAEATPAVARHAVGLLSPLAESGVAHADVFAPVWLSGRR